MRPLDWQVTALLMIDLQRDFLDPLGYSARAGLDVGLLRRAIAPAARLLGAAREAGMVIVHTREANAPDLSDVPPAFLEATRRTGAAVGTPGPLGRFLIRGEPGTEIVDEVRPAPGEIVIDKPGFSAFEGTALDTILRTRSIRTLLLCGVTTEVCVMSTLRTAIDRGFRCITVGDACGSAYPHLHDAALEMIGVEGGVFGEVAYSAEVAAVLEAM